MAPKRITCGGGGGVTVTVTGVAFADAPLPLVAVSVKLYDLMLLAVFAGRATFLEAEPELQDTVVGSPLIFVLLANLQVLAFVTIAVSVTAPPLDGKFDGDAVNDKIVGLVAIL